MIKNKEIAVTTNDLVLRIAADLDASVRLVRDNCDEEDFSRYRDFASQVLTTLLTDFMNPLYEAYPELRPPGLLKVERRTDKT